MHRTIGSEVSFTRVFLRYGVDHVEHLSEDTVVLSGFSQIMGFVKNMELFLYMIHETMRYCPQMIHQT